MVAVDRDGAVALRLLGAAALLIAIAALAVPAPAPEGAISWDGLLAPYSQGAPLLDDFRIAAVRCGSEDDVIVTIERPAAAAVEVHVLPRGRWTGIRESQSFGIGYETAHSPAAEREAITAVLAETLRARDGGLPSPGAIPLGTGLAARLSPWWSVMLRGWRGVLLSVGSLLLAAILLARSRTVALAGMAMAAIALLARAAGIALAPQPVCAALAAGDVIDPGVRAIQVGWLLLIAASPVLCWRAGRATGIGGGRLLLAAGIAVIVALASTWGRGDEPLHNNGHAWREAREVLMPWGERASGAAPFLHGRGGIALQWVLAGAERTLLGRANPFAISRFAAAAAAGATAVFAAILVGSPWAGLAAGCALALMPLAQMLAVSGSVLAVAEWIMPWSLALLLVAGRSGDRVALAGAALAAALGTLSHTAMLAWPGAMCAAWLLVARGARRRSAMALAALLVVALAWIVQLVNCYALLADRDQGAGVGLLQHAWIGILERNLLTDPRWVSPVLLPLVLVWVIAGLRRQRAAGVAASVLPVLLAAPPIFAVTVSSSDAVRYQGALLGLLSGLAVAGLWSIPVAARFGSPGRAVLRLALLAMLVLLPIPAWRPPLDPAAREHQLVVEAVRRIEPGTLVVLPPYRVEHAEVIADFPDFLLSDESAVAFEGDPRIATHVGPRLFYLGLACISWNDGEDVADMRPECRALRRGTQPWLVHSLRSEDLPRRRDGQLWTFHRLATGVPFGFFAPE